jgi:hypothetical protein
MCESTQVLTWHGVGLAETGLATFVFSCRNTHPETSSKLRVIGNQVRGGISLALTNELKDASLVFFAAFAGTDMFWRPNKQGCAKVWFSVWLDSSCFSSH